MTSLQVLGYSFLSFGPALILFFFTISSDPLKCIIMIASAFFWLFSLFLTSLFWFAIVPLRDRLLFSMICSVILQEGFKYVWYRILRTSEKGLQKISNVGSTNDHLLHFKGKNDRINIAYVSGFGFGLANASLSIINSLSDLIGPGTYGINDVGYNTFILTKALCAQTFIFLNIFWAIISYYGYDKREYSKVILVCATHLLAVILTYFNKYQFQILTISSLYSLVALLAIYTVIICGVTFNTFHKSLQKFVQEAVQMGQKVVS